MHAGRRLRSRARLLLLLALAAGSAGCDREDAGDRDHRDPEPGRYRAVLDVPGGELPFGLDLEQKDDGFSLVLLNGSERTLLGPATLADDRLAATLPGGGTLSAAVRGRELEGEVVLGSAGSGTPALPLRARHGVHWRFREQPLSDNADVAGRWAVRFDGATGPLSAVAEFTQSFEQLSARFRDAGGERPTLVGEVHDDEVALSRFDGEVAVLVRGRIQEDGRLAGDFWSAAGGQRRFTAERDPGAALAGDPVAPAAPASDDEGPVGHPALTPLPEVAAPAR